MTTQEAKAVARRHIQRLGVPSRLDGVRVQIAVYDDEDTLRFLKADEPDLTLESQRALNEAFALEMVRRGAQIQFVSVNVGDFFDWIAKFGLQNTPANRAQFISWLTAPEPKPTPIQR